MTKIVIEAKAILEKRVDLVFTLVSTHPLNAVGYTFRWRDPAGLC
jgi:hypothetical protein